MNSIRPGLNRSRAAAISEAAADAADAMDTIASKLEGVRDFALLALKGELEGGHHVDEAAEVVDAISDAIGKARQAESKISE